MLDIAERANASAVVYRSFDMDDVEIREADDGSGDLIFEGVASIVEHPYKVRDMFGEYTETIARGAFNKTLADGASRVSLYVNHRHSDVPLATRKAGTLTLTADPHLRVRGQFDPTRPDVQIVASAIRRREMTEMSIGFNAVKTRDVWNDDYTEVTRGEVALREVSIVEQGANTGGTQAAMRAFDDFMQTITDTDMSEDEVRRAIAHLESLLQTPEVEERIDEFAELRARQERRRHIPLAV